MKMLTGRFMLHALFPRLVTGLNLLLAVIFVVSAVASEKDADWPKWRGQRQDSKWLDADVFKFDEGYGLKVAWKKKLGSSYSSISIADGRAVTMFSDSTADFVVALDVKDGAEIWRFRISDTYKGHTGSHDGQISTPVIDDGKVFVFGRKGMIYALDAASGKLVWSRNAKEEYDAQTPFHGFGSSPVVVGDVLVVQTGGIHGRTVAGFNKATGTPLWSAENDTVNYQSPIAVTIGGRNQLICVANHNVAGIEPATGKRLWGYRHDGNGGNIDPVLIGDDKLFVNHSRNESMLLQLQTVDNQMSAKELWKTRTIRQTFNPSVYYEGYLYGYSSRFLTCLDTRTGEAAWKSRPPGDGFVIIVDGQLVVLTKQGTLHVAEASPEGYAELASMTLFDGLTWTPPSFAENRIFARSLTEIAAIDIAPVDQITKLEQPEIELLNLKGPFAKFVTELDAAPAGKKKELADAFIAKQKSFPIIEDGKFAHVVYYGDAADVAIQGDMLPSGQEVALRRVEGTDLFFISFELEPDARVDYALRENFDNVVPDPRNPHEVPSFAIQGGKASELAMPDWVRPTHFDAPSGNRGTIETFEFESKVLQNKRNVHVYLPYGYQASSDKYPTVYVNYGNFAKDMALMPNTLDNLIARNNIRPVIAVFVESPASFQEYARQLRDQHAQMYIEELVPHIDKTYRTIADGKSRLFMGADEGAYAAIYAAFKYPGSARMLAGQSTHLYTGNGGEELIALLQSTDKFEVDFYLDWATYGQRGPGFDWKADNRKLVDVLEEKGYEVESAQVNEGFGWASWRNRTDHILEKFVGTMKTQK